LNSRIPVSRADGPTPLKHQCPDIPRLPLAWVAAARHWLTEADLVVLATMQPLLRGHHDGFRLSWVLSRPWAFRLCNTLAYPDITFRIAGMNFVMAHVIGGMFESMGNTVEYVPADNQASFEAVRAGAADALWT